MVLESSKRFKASTRKIREAAASFRAPSALADKAIEQFFASCGTPLALKASSLYSSGKHAELLELDVDPSEYETADLFHLDYLAVSFLSKYKELKLPWNPKERAVAKFFEYEELCKDTNNRFRNHTSLEKGPYADWLYAMRWKIGAILGDFCPEEFFNSAGWGPGVSVSVKGTDTSASNKFQNDTGITREAFDLLSPHLGTEFPNWFREEHVSDSSVSIVPGNSVTSVPKNAKVDRIIAIEPGLNLYFQKGVGKMIRARMLAAGVNLNDQSVNQKLAKAGSLDGTLATVDFSSASDSISKELVRYLLPLDWACVMNSLRCQVGIVDGKTRIWEKFSSMGNGFTWELESLIFYAAALVTCERLGLSSAKTSVYGDDVIIDSRAFHGFEKFCTYLGFRVNGSKSFWTGPFRESCGEHYFLGVSVTPIFMKEALSDVTTVYKLANSIRRLAHRRNFGYGCDARFRNCFTGLVKRVPRDLRLQIPEGFGDGGFLASFDEATPSIRRPANGWGGYLFTQLTAVPVKKYHGHIGHLNARLAMIRGAAYPVKDKHGRWSVTDFPEFDTLSDGNFTPLRRQTVASVNEVIVPDWIDFGPWI